MWVRRKAIETRDTHSAHGPCCALWIVQHMDQQTRVSQFEPSLGYVERPYLRKIINKNPNAIHYPLLQSLQPTVHQRQGKPPRKEVEGYRSGAVHLWKKFQRNQSSSFDRMRNPQVWGKEMFWCEDSHTGWRWLSRLLLRGMNILAFKEKQNLGNYKFKAIVTSWDCYIASLKLA